MIAASHAQLVLGPVGSPEELAPAADALPGETDNERADRLDTLLMARFRDSGERDAFDALYRHARARVFEWLRRVLREQRVRLDPVDLLQDTFVNVYRYASSFRSEQPSSFRVWVRTIAANVVRRARSNAARRATQTLDANWSEPVDTHLGPPRRVSDGEERSHLCVTWLLFLEHYAQAFAQLSARDRRALELVELEGRTYAETGAQLGVGPSNMKMIMLRARKRLQARMRAAMTGPSAARRLSA